MNLYLPAFLDTMFPTLTGKWGMTNVNINQIVEDLMKLLGSSESNPFLNPEYCDRWKNFIHKIKEVDYTWGGYMEDRATVWRGHYHAPGHTLHLGVDFYVPVDTTVHVPVNGKLIHSAYDKDENGGWGGWMVFQISPTNFFLLGHLKEIADKIGKVYLVGDRVGAIAEPEVNGGWSPHLHLQRMTKFDKSVDGYTKHYQGIENDYPDPLVFPWEDAKCHYCEMPASKTLVWLKDKQQRPARIELPWCGCDLMVALKRFWLSPYQVVEGIDYEVQNNG